MTSRHQPTPRKLSLRAVGVSVLLVASMALSGCSLLPGEAPATDAAPAATSKAPVKDGANTPESKAPEEKQAEKVSAAEEMSGKLKATLTTLASTTKAPNREQMMAAMLEAGAVKEKVEVSIDITPTGLAVDAIESATLVGKECVIGQVRGGNVAVTTLPVLASGRCFVGDVH